VGIWNLVENLFRTLDTKKSGVLLGNDAKLFIEKLLKLKVMNLDPEAIADLRALADSDAGITIESYTAIVLRGEQRQLFELRSKVILFSSAFASFSYAMVAGRRSYWSGAVSASCRLS
jgi:hypothetical protein